MMTLCSISSLLLFLNRLHQIYQIRSTLGGGGGGGEDDDTMQENDFWQSFQMKNDNSIQENDSWQSIFLN
jgi:hypothetical protein